MGHSTPALMGGAVALLVSVSALAVEPDEVTVGRLTLPRVVALVGDES